MFRFVAKFATLAASFAITLPTLGLSQALPQPPAANHDLGFTDTLMLPGLPFHVHDPGRPHPPLVVPATFPGGVYDIFFEAPVLDGDKVLKLAFVTVLFNGVLVHHHKEIMGPMVYRQVAKYVAQPAEDSVVLQNHNSPVRYRNIWVRKIGAYNQPEKK